MYKVLVGEYIDDEAIQLLNVHEDIEVDVKIGISREEILKIIHEYDALIVRSVIKVDKELLERAKKLKIVGRAGNGTDNINIPEATNYGVIVANTPDSNTVSACEIAIGLLLASARNIVHANNFIKSGKWEREIFVGSELFEKTLGIIGLGRIGGLTATRMKAFGMNLIAYDPYISDERFKRYHCRKAETLDELFREADIITIHTPKTEETLNIINSGNLHKLKDGVRLVNAARGGLFNEEAVAEGLETGKIASFGYDVHTVEPRETGVLYEYENAVATPHIGATTYEAQRNVGFQVVKQVLNGLRGEIVETAVNLPSMDREEFAAVKPYIYLAEKLGKIYYQIKKEPVTGVKINYYGELSEQETALIDSTVIKGLLEPVLKEEINYINSLVLAEKRDISISSNKKERKYENYLSALEIIINNSKNESIKIVGIVGINGEKRIININDYFVDIVIADNMLILQNDDVPGVIGLVGKILGEEKVNIATMYVGRKEGSALMMLTVDEPVKKSSAEKLNKADEIKWAYYLNLK
ncbi:MAG: phosphoglycerate dehydrogenase [Leptotrichiaceae bacterium]|nr:phosphoglycerate dehydrogenase [Leptotrichiaceae bacterium]